MIREELQLVTTGTGAVLKLAEALERAADAQARLGGGAGGGGSGGRRTRTEAERQAEIAARKESALAAIAARKEADSEKSIRRQAEIKLRAESAASVIQARAAAQVQGVDARAAAQFQLRQQQAIIGLVRDRYKLEQQSARAATTGARATERAGREAATRARSRAASIGRGRGAGALSAAGSDDLSLTDMKSALDLATQVASRVGEIAVRAGGAVIQAQAFREDVSRGLETILRSRTEAQKALSTAAQAADFIGRGRAEVTGDFLDLLTKGFSTGKTDEIVKRLADLQTVDPRANQAGIVRAIGQIAGKGRLQGDELLQLAEAGLETKSVYDALSKSLGKTTPELIKLQAAGKITSDVAVEAILEAIKTQTGGKGAGAAANEKSMNDLSGLINRVKSIPENILFDLDLGPGVEKTKGTLREIITFFDASTKSGQDVRRVVSDTINAFAEGLFGVDTSGGVTETLTNIVAVIKDSKDDIRDFGRALRDIGSALQFAARFLGIFRAAADGDSAGVVASALGSTITSSIKASLDSAFAAIAAAPGQLFAAGANLMSSLGAGITSTAQVVIDAVTSTVGGAIAWAKKLLGIASPSRVFMGIGAYTSQGFVAGIASNDNAVAAAAGAMAQRAIGGAAGAAFPAAGGPAAGAVGAGAAAAGQGGSAGAGASGVSIGQVYIDVRGARTEAEAASMGDAAGRAFLDRLRVWYPVYVREQAA